MRACAAMLLCALVAAATAAPAPLPRKADPDAAIYAALRKGGSYRSGALTVRAKEVRGATLVGVSLERAYDNGLVVAIALAQEGEVRVGKGGKTLVIRLRRGEAVDPFCSARTSFDEQVFELPAAMPPLDWGDSGVGLRLRF